jgi:glucokinase
MARRARVMLEQEHNLPSALRDLTGGHLEQIDPVMIQQAARRGDRVAKAIVEETGFYLGAWLGGMISVLDPEVIVIGGGVAQIGKPLFDKIKETIPHYTDNRQAGKTPVLPAKLQKNVGVYGAASVFLPSGEDAATM